MNITSLSVVPGLEGKLCFCTANNGIYAVNIKNENALGIDDIPLEQLTEPFPSGPVKQNKHKMNFRLFLWMYVPESH
jgi:hypothetical protein